MEDIDEIISKLNNLHINCVHNQSVADYLIPQIQQNIDIIINAFEVLKHNIGLLSPVITGNREYSETVSLIGRQTLALRDQMAGVVGQPLPPMDNNVNNEVIDVTVDPVTNDCVLCNCSRRAILRREWQRFVCHNCYKRYNRYNRPNERLNFVCDHLDCDLDCHSCFIRKCDHIFGRNQSHDE